MERRTLISGSLLATALTIGYVGQSALRGSLLDDASIDMAMHMRADTNSDGVLSARELRVSLVDILRGVLLKRDGYDIDGDGTVNRADLTHAKQSLRRLLTATCGNGTREGSETCDDGDTDAGDGCSTTCRVESGYSCNTATPNVCTTGSVCGNGTREGSETCDDGDTDAGDGCSPACLVEDGYLCTIASSGDCRPAACLDERDGDSDGAADLFHISRSQEFPVAMQFLGESTKLRRAYFYVERPLKPPLLKIYSTEDVSLLSEREASVAVGSLRTDEARSVLYGIVPSGAEDRFVKMDADAQELSSIGIRTGLKGYPPGSSILLSDDNQHAAVFTRGSFSSFTSITRPNGSVVDTRTVYDSVSVRVVDLNTFAVTSTFIPDVPSILMSPVAMRGTKVWYLTVRNKELWSETPQERVVLGAYDAVDGSHTEAELPYQALGDVDGTVVVGDTVFFMAKKQDGLEGGPYAWNFSVNDTYIVGASLANLKIVGERRFVPPPLRRIALRGTLSNGHIWGWLFDASGFAFVTFNPHALLTRTTDLSMPDGMFGVGGSIYDEGAFIVHSHRYQWSGGSLFEPFSSSFYYTNKSSRVARLTIEADTECHNPEDPE